MRTAVWLQKRGTRLGFGGGVEERGVARGVVGCGATLFGDRNHDVENVAFYSQRQDELRPHIV